jgi:hypothetical protein
MWTRTCLAPFAVALAVYASPASADPSADPWRENLDANELRMFRPDVLRLVKLAEVAEKAGRMVEAIEHYEHASELGGGAVDTEVELGLAYLRAGRHLEAAQTLGFLMHFANAKVRHPRVVRAALDEAKRHVGAIRIHVNVEGATLNVDGASLADWPFHHTVYVTPGKHNVKATKEGYWMSQTTVEVAAGEDKELLVAMQERVSMKLVNFATPTHVTMKVQTANVEKNPTWPAPLMIASGVGIGIGTGALVFGLVLHNNAKTDETATTWTGVAAAGGIIGAVSLTGLIIGAVGLASRPAPPPVIIQPSFGQDGAGVAVSGKW